MVDVFIWLFAILMVLGPLWLIRVIVRWTPPSARPATVRLPPPPAAAPGYLPKWDGTRRWAVREDKAAWDGAFKALVGPPVPLPKPTPTPDEAAVFARLRDRLDHL